MKRITMIISAVLLVVVGTASITYAATVQLPWTKNIYNVSDIDVRYGSSVSILDNAGNRCYIVKSSNSENSKDPVAISCVRMDK